MHSRVATPCHAGRYNHRLLQFKCTAAWHLRVLLLVIISVCFKPHSQPRGISVKCWSLVQRLLQNECTATWQGSTRHACTAAWPLRVMHVVIMNACIKLDVQPRGISASCWSLPSASASKQMPPRHAGRYIQRLLQNKCTAT